MNYIKAVIPFVLLILSVLQSLNAKEVLYYQLHDEIALHVKNANSVKNSTFFLSYQDDITNLENCYSESENYINTIEVIDAKRYLKLLRSCEKKAKSFERYYVKALSEATSNRDNTLFTLLLEINPTVLKHNRFIEKSIRYYRSVKKKFPSKIGNAYLKAYNIEQHEQELAAQELAVFEANLKILEYSAAKYSKDKDGNERTFFIGYKKENGKTILIAENKNSYPISVEVSFNSLENFSVNVATPYMFVVDRNSVIELMELSPIDTSLSSYVSWKYSYIMGTYGSNHLDSYLYAVPFAKNTRVTVSQGNQTNRTHKGRSQYAVDFAVKTGTRIYAARGGVVLKTESSFNKAGYDKSFAKFANYITIEHDDKTFAQYYHLKKDGVRVQVGQRVSRGEFIGLSGNTGYSSGPHLHFGVYKVIKDTSLSSVSIPIEFKTKRGIVASPKKGDIFVSVR